ncbi:tetratricopeptide repeat protein [Sphingosinicella sp. BN140058]|uniref:tetratricopeptide repeat protein n=1 Tax=Sphingosinicella sp. BN140058 TaxID=1892855 RepID=UPI001010A40E|nr:tetratricopeptide repeat protein [Sphingosinicella sp. BN140058]QAY76125.1 tetratricopeptide repeat protein [Sphingosinicella sp. BN140058]
MAFLDTHGLPLSTSSEQAADLYRQGVTLMLAAWPGAAEMLDAAIAADPDFALAQAARARAHAIRSEPAAARARIAAAEAIVARNGTEREASHVAVLADAIAGRSRQALAAALAHVDLWPRDILILSLPLGAFGLFAFSGMADHDQARVSLVEKHAGRFDADDWWFLTYRGWALAEHGEVARGRAMLERAFELRRQNANGVHALAHAMFEGGAGEDADALIAGWLPDYDRSGILHGHIAWHAALTALERGDAAAALALYEAHVHPSVSQGAPINIVSDAASLLWRMQAYGHAPTPDRWKEIADYAAGAFPEPGHAFVDPHMALIEAALGDAPALETRAAALERRIADGALPAGAVVPAIARAAMAFAAEDHAACIRILEPVMAEVARIGGSGAQREIVEDMLLVALMRSGEAAKARALLDRRLHRRPSPRDARWRAQLAA